MQQKIRSNLRRPTTSFVMVVSFTGLPTRCRRMRKAAGRAWVGDPTVHNVDLINFVQHEPNPVLRSDQTGRVRQSLMIRPQTRGVLAVATVVATMAALVGGGCRRAPAEQSARRPETSSSSCSTTCAGTRSATRDTRMSKRRRSTASPTKASTSATPSARRRCARPAERRS